MNFTVCELYLNFLKWHTHPHKKYIKRKEKDPEDSREEKGLRENLVFQKKKEALMGLLGPQGKGGMIF